LAKIKAKGGETVYSENCTIVEAITESPPQIQTSADPEPIEQQIEQWTTAPELLRLLQLARVFQALLALANRLEQSWLLLPEKSGKGSGQATYSDLQIMLTAIVQAVWKLSQHEVCRWLKKYPQLAQACGYQVGRTISQSHYSRRLRHLGLTVWVIYFLWLVR
jgi:hypothetical protein